MPQSDRLLVPQPERSPARVLRNRIPPSPREGFVIPSSDSRHRLPSLSNFSFSVSPSQHLRAPSSSQHRQPRQSTSSHQLASAEPSDEEGSGLGDEEDEPPTPTRKRQKGRAAKPQAQPTTTASKKRRKNNDGPEVPAGMDINQDSDIEEIEAPENPRSRKVQNERVTELLKFFHAPTHVLGEERSGGRPRKYKCRCCKYYFICAKSSYSNLKGHRDGTDGRPACPQRHKALAMKITIPPTFQELAADSARSSLAASKRGTLDNFVSREKFNVDTQNKMLVIWVVRQAQPWARFEDQALRAAFRFGNVSSVIRSASWAARQARLLYKALKTSALALVLQNDSRFHLVHDGWTSTGNRHAFIGFSACFIDADWKYRVIHLGLKFVAWRHFGALLARPVARFLIRHGLHDKMVAKTTDSGANNGPMAREISSQFSSASKPVTWDARRYHIRCYAHKLALVVKAGLDYLKIGPKEQKLTSKGRGQVPDVPLIELNDGTDDLDADDLDSESEHSDDDGSEVGSEHEGEEEDDGNFNLDATIREVEAATERDARPNQFKTDLVVDAVRKIDTVSRLVSRSAARRNRWTAIASEIGYKGPRPSPPYAQRWNALYENRKQMCESSVVNVKMLSEDTSGYFKDIMISANEWNAIRQCNDIFALFAKATKRVEGDFSSAAIVLTEFHSTIDELEALSEKVNYKSLFQMLKVMISKFKVYEREALRCDAVIIATVLNPRCRIKFFDLYYPEHAEHAKKLIKKIYDEAVETSANNHPQDSGAISPSAVQPKDKYDVFALDSGSAAALEDELDTYLSGRNPCRCPEILFWWRDNIAMFPILRKLAKDFLACTATSCCEERKFNSAGAIATTRRGGLAAKTIEQLVGSREWLRREVPVPGEWDEAIQLVNSSKNRSK